ncbi:RusA family crossover junction endodeoxyribonuclease [Priestia filamentosa]|uniref:RusA family crossover junction endodeoxyribonuclease n=1 Tax=Priestia filamentosa TaxID=1402861 RepID=UPI003979F95A
MNRLTLPLMMYKESGSEARGTKKRHWVVPTWNHLYTIVSKITYVKGKPKASSTKILDSWALKHKEKIEVLTRNWIEENDWVMTEGRKIYVDAWVYFPDARERDCHNIDKVIMDAFEDAEVYDNDCNALLRYQDFDIDIDNPRIEIEFTVGECFNRKKRVEELKKIKKAEKRRD